MGGPADPGGAGGRQLLLNAADIDHKVRRLAFQILERYPQREVAFVGILTRGATVAERVRAILAADKPGILCGTLDVSLYRDDLNRLDKLPALEGSAIPFEVEGAHVILFDEVIFTGRTVRAAIGSLMDYGRPAKIELAALVDRGNRELPIQPDYVGEVIATRPGDHVAVRLREVDGEEGVYLERGAKPGATDTTR
jgi:pyrimidine operon attenuation protein/uracil phosphoribosyltransferase